MTTSPSPRPLTIACLLQPGKVSRDVFQSLIRGLQSLGHRCAVIELAQLWARIESQPAQREQFLSEATASLGQVFKQQRVDLCIAMWSNALVSLAHARRDGRVMSCFDLMQPPVPHLMYWLDAPHWAASGNVRDLLPTGIFRSPSLYSVVNNPATAEEMRAVLGFRHAAGLPYGIDPAQYASEPPPMESREFDLAFSLGPGDPPPTPAALQELDREEPDMLRLRTEQADLHRPALLAMVDRVPAPLRDSMGQLFTRLLQSQLASRATPMLRRLESVVALAPGLRDAAQALIADRNLFMDATNQIRQVESMERAFTIAYLARRYKTLVFGDCDISAWNAKATTVPYVKDQVAEFRRARVGLSVMRWQDDIGLHLKPFEIAAAGTAPLIAQRHGLEALFAPGRDCEAFTTPAEAARQLWFLLAAPARLDAIAQAARTRTLTEHTWAKRAQAMLDEIARDRGGWIAR